MINSLEIYRDAGQKCAVAANQRDQGRISHWNHWYQRALNLELPADRQAAQTAYTQGYKEKRIVNPKS